MILAGRALALERGPVFAKGTGSCGRALVSRKSWIYRCPHFVAVTDGVFDPVFVARAG